MAFLIEIGLRLRNEQALGPTGLNDAAMVVLSPRRKLAIVSPVWLPEREASTSIASPNPGLEHSTKLAVASTASALVLSSDAWGTRTYVCMSNMSERRRPERNTGRSMLRMRKAFVHTQWPLSSKDC